MLWPRPQRVSLETLGRLVRVEGLGTLPEVLAPESGWRPAADERALDAAVKNEVARLGWLDERGRLEVDIATALRTLCQRATEFSAWITVGEDTTSVIAAALGKSALIAIGQGDWVSLQSVGSRRLAQVVVAQTPDVGAGPGEPFKVRRKDVLAFDNKRRSHGGVAVRPVPLEVRRLHEIAELGQTGAGELHVAVRDEVGRRREQAVSYVDTAVGRYVTLVENEEMLVVPGDHRTLLARLEAAHQLVQSG